MKPVKSPLASIALAVMGWPIGILLGYLVVRWVEGLSTSFTRNIPINLMAIILAAILARLGLRWALPQEELSKPGRSLQLARLGVLFVSVLVSFYGLFQLASLAMNLGSLGTTTLGPLAFIGNFLFQLGDIVGVITPALGGLAAGGALSSFMARPGQRSTEKLSPGGAKVGQKSSTSFFPRWQVSLPLG